MPITQQIGSSSLNKPGVCTSTTRPSSPYDGMVIYETDTDRTLVWNGSGWVYLSTSSVNPVGMELITGVGCSAGGTASNGVVTIGSGVSSVVVTNAFNASYDNYKILVSGTGTASTGAGYLTLQLGSVTSSYRYDYISANLASATPTSAGSVGAANFPYIGFKGANCVTAVVEVNSPFLATQTMVSAFAGQVGNNMGTLVGVLVDSTSITGFTLGASTGTISGGNIRVYGYRNSA